MSTNDSFRSVRTGNVRVSAGNYGMGRSARYTAAEDIALPALEELGHQPFTLTERDALTRWLDDVTWPRGTMNIYALEGYLVAVLLLPLGLRASVWMPTIWNEKSGWKVPLTIQAPERYATFMEMLIGFMRFINAGLEASTPQFESILDTLDSHNQKTMEFRRDWVNGFARALQRCAHTSALNDETLRTALYAIANHTSRPARNGLQTLTNIEQAVLLLAKVRASRDPLGESSFDSKMIKGR